MVMQVSFIDSEVSEDQGTEFRFRTDRRHCPHCNKWLSLKTYKNHKRKFYDLKSDYWYKQGTELDVALSPEYDTDSAPSITEVTDDEELSISSPPAVDVLFYNSIEIDSSSDDDNEGE